MLDLTAGLISSLATGGKGFTLALKITRVDGTVKRWARTLAGQSISGDTYTAVAGFKIGSVSIEANSGPTHIRVTLAAVSGSTIGVSQPDIRSGIYDAARATVYLINHQTPADGAGVLAAGTVGEISITNRGLAQFDIVGILGKAGALIVEHYVPTCLAWFGDDNPHDQRCGVPLASHTTAATVVSASGRNVVVSGIASADDHFNLGKIKITAGASKGRAFAIKDWTNSSQTLELFAVPDGVLQAGDTINISTGCDRTSGALGCGRYSNILRFQGFEFVPGGDAKARVYQEWQGA